MDEFAIGEFVRLQNGNTGKRTLPRRSCNPLPPRQDSNVPDNSAEFGPEPGSCLNRGLIPRNGTLIPVDRTQSNGVRQPGGPAC